MQNKLKPFIKDVIWLTLAFGLTMFSINIYITNNALDIHLHDTYFVVSPWLISTSLFLLATFIIYFVKEKRKSFGRTIQNWLIVILGFSLIILLNVLIKSFSHAIGELTWYPPLSGLGKSKDAVNSPNPIAIFIVGLLRIMQLLVLILLLFFTYSLWSRKRIKHGK
jgi:hypothetical protein